MVLLAPTEALLDEGSIVPGDELLAVRSQGFIGFAQPHTRATHRRAKDTTAAPSMRQDVLMKDLREVEGKYR